MAAADRVDRCLTVVIVVCPHANAWALPDHNQTSRDHVVSLDRFGRDSDTIQGVVTKRTAGGAKLAGRAVVHGRLEESQVGSLPVVVQVVELTEGAWLSGGEPSGLKPTHLRPFLSR